MINEGASSGRHAEQQKLLPTQVLCAALINY